MIYTLPLLVRTKIQLDDVEMLMSLLISLDSAKLVIYNQGCLKNEIISDIYPNSDVLGNGVNVGIPLARQACFEHVWRNYPDEKFIVECHVDMRFNPDWEIPLIEYLERTDEPLVCPGIINGEGHFHPIDRTPRDNPKCEDFRQDRIVEGFVHPVIHKSECLKAVGGYNTKFINAQQGYEDDSLLLAYHYYMGTRVSWRPKCNLNSVVYHRTLVQRMSLDNVSYEANKNLMGLLNLYGFAGLRELGYIHDSEYFRGMYESYGRG